MIYYEAIYEFSPFINQAQCGIGLANSHSLLYEKMVPVFVFEENSHGKFLPFSLYSIFISFPLLVNKYKMLILIKNHFSWLPTWFRHRSCAANIGIVKKSQRFRKRVNFLERKLSLRKVQKIKQHLMFCCCYRAGTYNWINVFVDN